MTHHLDDFPGLLAEPAVFYACIRPLRELAAAFSRFPSLRDALRAKFDGAANPDRWDAPASSRRLYRARVLAAITAWLAANVTSEVKPLSSAGRFTFEPED